ncbi:MAG: radical SAM/SPASM domain-containing protein [Methanosarcinales archaeon]
MIYNKITSIGVGLTSKCNLNCPHCYSKRMKQGFLSIDDIYKILEKFPNLRKVNFGTGESILNKDFLKIIDIFHDKSIEMGLTTNSYTISQLSNEDLVKFKDIDVSLDFPVAHLHDQWRGKRGTFNNAIRAIQRCSRLKINVSIALALMNINYKFLPRFKKLIDKYDAFLRINLYKPVYTKKYLLTYDQFWQAIELLADNFTLVSNSEPILSLVIDSKMKGAPCGKSVRIHPDMTISPCVYLTNKICDVETFNMYKKQIPKECKNCRFLESCNGGCLARRILTQGYSYSDLYCPIVNKKSIPNIKFKKSKYKDLIHSAYLCTIILK